MAATSSVDLLLQNGLAIDSDGRCHRHPEEVIVGVNGRIFTCKACKAEQEHFQDESLRISGIGGECRSRQSLDSDLGISISKMMTSLSSNGPVPRTVDTLQKNGSNSNKHGNNSSQSVDNDTEEEEEAEDSMESLIARWCQLQEANGAPTADMLGSTLILLQLQKMDRRMELQDKSIQNLSDAVEKQQASIQNDLSQILRYMAVSASNAQNAQTQLVLNSSHTTGFGATHSAVSALSGESGASQRSAAHHLGRVTALNASSSPEMMAVSPSTTANQSTRGNLHPSSVFTSVRTIERQPPKPPERHDSAKGKGLLLGRYAPGVSSGDLSGSSSYSYTSSDKKKPTTTPTTTTTTTALKPTEPNVNRGGLTQSKFQKISSFRNATPQLDVIWDTDHTKSQDTNDHTKSQSTIKSEATSKNNNNNHSLFRQGKRPPILASSLDEDEEDQDDDDEDDENDDEREANLFSGMKSYMELKKEAAGNSNSSGLPALINHESIDTFGLSSFMGDEDDTAAQDESLLPSPNHENTPKEEPSEAEPEPAEDEDDDVHHTLSAAETDDDDDDDEEENGHDTSNDFSGQGQKKKLSKKQKKALKKLEKARKKELKKEKKKQLEARAAATPIIVNNKVSPANEEGKKHSTKKRRFRSVTKKIVWKRGSRRGKEGNKHEDTSDSRDTTSNNSTGPTPPRPRDSTSNGLQQHEFCVFNDNPRSHLMPTASTIDIVDFEQSSPLNFSKPVQRKHPDTTTVGNTAPTDAEETMTVKTPMTAKTPLTAIQRRYPTDMEPPPPPQRQYAEFQPSSFQPGQRKVPNDIHPHSPQQHQQHSRQFPRSRGMMPTLMNSKREIVITGESARLQVSTLTLDTALPSADVGAYLQEVTHQAITDKCKERGTYTGTVDEDEQPDGYGTMIYNSGAFYKGYWKEGHWHGNGILRTPNGDSYEGDFVYDCRHGRGIYKYENGDVYEGDFSSDKRHGKGTFLFQNGSMYRGDFAYGNFHGYGWYEFEEGYYEGSWADGVYEGIGSLMYKDGSHYTGRFRGGVADGMGEEMQADGTSKRGIWKNGEFVGQVDNVEASQFKA